MKKSFRSISFYIILPIIIIMIMMMTLRAPGVGSMSFSDLVNAIEDKKVSAIEIGDATTIVEIEGKKYNVEVNQLFLLSVVGDEIQQQIKELSC